MTFFEILMSLSVSLIQSPNNSSKSAINLVDKGLYATMNGWCIDPLRNIHRWCYFYHSSLFYQKMGCYSSLFYQKVVSLHAGVLYFFSDLNKINPANLL